MEWAMGLGQTLLRALADPDTGANAAIKLASWITQTLVFYILVSLIRLIVLV